MNRTPSAKECGEWPLEMPIDPGMSSGKFGKFTEGDAGMYRSSRHYNLTMMVTCLEKGERMSSYKNKYYYESTLGPCVNKPGPLILPNAIGHYQSSINNNHTHTRLQNESNEDTEKNQQTAAPQPSLLCEGLFQACWQKCRARRHLFDIHPPSSPDTNCGLCKTPTTPTRPTIFRLGLMV